jgi:hypothetical protein
MVIRMDNHMDNHVDIRVHVDIHLVIKIGCVWIRQWLSRTDKYGYSMVIHLV